MASRRFRVLNSFQGSGLVADRHRVGLLQFMGLDVDDTAFVADRVNFRGARVRFGPGSAMQHGCSVDEHVSIGERSRIGPYVGFFTSTHPVLPVGPYRRGEGWEERPIHVERGCWIGARSVILPGVTIAEGCVIGAGSVIDRDTVPNALYVGSRPRSPSRLYPARDARAGLGDRPAADKTSDRRVGRTRRRVYVRKGGGARWMTCRSSSEVGRPRSRMARDQAPAS